VKYVLSFLVGVAFGIIPFSYILGRLRGHDITQSGSKNIGATNLGRALGLPYFIMGFVLDALKGIIPVLVMQSVSYPAICAGVGAIAGHVFNPIFAFKGGKGVSTTIGVTIGLVPTSFLVSIAAWLLVYFTSFIVSLASISFAVVLVVVIFLLREGSPADRFFITIISVFIIYAHRSNIKRLFTNKEPKTVFWRKR
jgi:glycerol-3-phosphate acyltransferase PlsY